MKFFSLPLISSIPPCFLNGHTQIYLYDYVNISSNSMLFNLIGWCCLGFIPLILLLTALISSPSLFAVVSNLSGLPWMCFLDELGSTISSAKSRSSRSFDVKFHRMLVSPYATVFLINQHTVWCLNFNHLIFRTYRGYTTILLDNTVNLDLVLITLVVYMVYLCTGIRNVLPRFWKCQWCKTSKASGGFECVVSSNGEFECVDLTCPTHALLGLYGDQGDVSILFWWR